MPAESESSTGQYFFSDITFYDMSVVQRKTRWAVEVLTVSSENFALSCVKTVIFNIVDSWLHCIVIIIPCIISFDVLLCMYCHRWWDKPLTGLTLKDCHISANTKCSQAINYMKGQSLTTVPVVSDDK